MENIPDKAYEDLKFLKRDECRSVRLQLEYLKPQVVMEDMDVRSTVVIFGSARTLPPEQAQARLEAAERALEQNPDDCHERHDVKVAKNLLKHSRYYAVARELAAEISKFGQAEGKLDYVVTTGGGPGIMEAANRGATDVDAKSIGLNITLPHEQFPNPYITDELNFMFHYFSIRKMHFLLRARALFAFPGGFGTLDELFETLTLIQTHKSPKIPVVLYGKEYWEELVNWQTFVDWGTISEEDLDLFRYVDTVQEGLDIIKAFYHP